MGFYSYFRPTKMKVSSSIVIGLFLFFLLLFITQRECYGEGVKCDNPSIIEFFSAIEVLDAVVLIIFLFFVYVIICFTSAVITMLVKRT